MTSHSLCLFLFDISLSLTSSSPSMLSQMIGFLSFSWLNNIPLCVCVCVCVCEWERHLYPFMCWQTVYFHILAIKSNAAINMRTHISHQYSVFISSGYILRNGIAGSYGSSVFNFLKNFILFSIVAAPIHIPTNSVWVFPFLQVLTSTHYYYYFL